MEFTWDAIKRASNFAKHKLDLARGAELFDGRRIFTYPSPRGDEARFVSVGVIDERWVALVWLERNDQIRLISLRRARSAEKRKFSHDDA